jgi:hypothetical protein
MLHKDSGMQSPDSYPCTPLLQCDKSAITPVLAKTWPGGEHRHADGVNVAQHHPVCMRLQPDGLQRLKIRWSSGYNSQWEARAG